jgi:hypothetical protein
MAAHGAVGSNKLRGYSSAGRAPALQAGGQRFEPAYLHQDPQAGWRKSRAQIGCEPLISGMNPDRLIFDNQATTGNKIQVGQKLASAEFPEGISGGVNFMVKLLRAHGGCLGEGRR